MKPADFFETSHFLENDETADNNPPAIFFNGGVIMRKTVKIIAILTMLVLMFAGVSVAGIPAAERDALTELYNSTDGDNWTNSTNWIGDAGTECSWLPAMLRIIMLQKLICVPISWRGVFRQNWVASPA